MPLLSMHQAIQDEIGGLLAHLEDAGFEIVESSYDEQSFGDFSIELQSEKAHVHIIRDRGQLYLRGDRRQLEPVDLWRVYDDRVAFQAAVLAYLEIGT